MQKEKKFSPDSCSVSRFNQVHKKRHVYAPIKHMRVCVYFNLFYYVVLVSVRFLLSGYD